MSGCTLCLTGKLVLNRSKLALTFTSSAYSTWADFKGLTGANFAPIQDQESDDIDNMLEFVPPAEMNPVGDSDPSGHRGHERNFFRYRWRFFDRSGASPIEREGWETNNIRISYFREYRPPNPFEMISQHAPRLRSLWIAGIYPLVLPSIVTLTVSAELTNRWSFNNAAGNAPAGTAVTDSVGTATAAVVGINASFNGASLVLPGDTTGNQSPANISAYVDLPNGLDFHQDQLHRGNLGDAGFDQELAAACSISGEWEHISTGVRGSGAFR